MLHSKSGWASLLQCKCLLNQHAHLLHAHRTITIVSTSIYTLAGPTKPSPSSHFPNSLPTTHRLEQVARHISSTSRTKMAPTYTTRKIGAPYTLEHRVYIEKDGVPVSAFHDVPLYANEQQTVLNMIVEIPRWTNAKLEVS